MKSIDTFYNGNYFRSRLEARWAVFFDEIGVKYQYEPEGFKNSNGECYLPDFFLSNVSLRSYPQGERFDENLSDIGLFFEVKPENYKEEDFKIQEWWNGKYPLILAIGDILNKIWGFNGDQNMYQLYPGWDNYMKFFKCSLCEFIKIEFHEGNYNDCPVCSGGCNEKLLYRAALKAQTIRFEHKY
jgi:hypothetical protein